MFISKKTNIVISIIVVLSIMFTFTGCSSYEEDTTISFDDNLIDTLDGETDDAVNIIEELSNNSDDGSSCIVLIKLNCRENTFFDTYDVHLYIDYTYEAKLEHGATNIYSVELEKGQHTLIFKNEDATSYINDTTGSVVFSVSEDTVLSYEIHCDHYQIEVNKVTEELGKINKTDIIKFEKTAYIPSDKEIGKKGFIYTINNTYNFEKSDFIIHNLKVCYAGQGYYFITFDYTIKNKSDDVLKWSTTDGANLYGNVTTNTVQNVSLGDNYNIFDFEFGKTKISTTLDPGEEFHGYELLLFRHWDEHYKEVMLHENEHMIYNLYYSENDTKNCCTVELNK